MPTPAAQSTGDPRVDEAVAGLDRLRELPLDEHPAVLESVHDKLREVLGELGDAGARPAESRPGRPGQRGEQGQLSPGGTPLRTRGGTPDEEPRMPDARQGR
jgi:hypothetical protein